MWASDWLPRRSLGFSPRKGTRSLAPDRTRDAPWVTMRGGPSAGEEPSHILRTKRKSLYDYTDQENVSIWSWPIKSLQPIERSMVFLCLCGRDSHSGAYLLQCVLIDGVA